MTDQRPKLTDDALEQALSRRAPHGPESDLLPAIVAQAAGTRQARRSPLPGGIDMIDTRRRLLLVAALVSIAALVGIIVAGAGGRDELSAVPSVDPPASPPFAASPTPGRSARPDASPTDCTTDHVVVLQGSDMPPAMASPGDLSGLGQVAATYLTSTSAWWNWGIDNGLHLDGDRSDVWATRPGDAGIARRVAVVGGPDVNIVSAADLSPDGSMALVILGKLSGGSANPECTDVYAIRTDGTGSRRLSRAGPGQLVLGAALTPDGARVAYVESAWRPSPPGSAGRWDSRVHIVELAPAGGERTIDLPCVETGYSSRIQWSPTGDRVAVGCGGIVAVVDPSGRLPVQEVQLVGQPTGFAWTGSTQLTLSSLASAGPTVERVDVATGERNPLGTSDGGPVEWVSGWGGDMLSPDGRWLLAYGLELGANPYAGEAVGYLVATAGGTAIQVLDFAQHAVGWDDSGGLLYMDRSDPATEVLWRLDAESGGRSILATLDQSVDWGNFTRLLVRWPTTP